MLGAVGTEKTERRGFLKGTLASAGSSISIFGFTDLGLGGTRGRLTGEAARQEMRRNEKVKRQYNNPKAVRKAVENHAEELLNTLVSKSLLSSKSAKDLPIDHVLPAQEYIEADEGVHIGAVKAEGIRTAHIAITKQLPTAELVMFVQPETDRSYATLRQGGETTLITSDGITTDACPETGCHCNDIDCSCASPFPEKRELFCPDNADCLETDSCAWGNVVGCCDSNCNHYHCWEYCTDAC